MITIKEISDRLGLSQTTVSNVVRGKTSEVSPKTVARVQAALEQYHYVPNMSARTLAQKSSRIIGMQTEVSRPPEYTSTTVFDIVLSPV